MKSCYYSLLRYVHIIALLIVCSGIDIPITQAAPRSEKELEAFINRIVDTSVKYGDIPSINTPKYISVNNANLSLENKDHVFVVFIPESEPRIYPQKIMVWHEIVNDYVNGQTYAITYSPISGSMAAYSTTLNGINLILDNEGKLYNNNSILIDRNTGSLWSQMLGMAFDGPLKGKGLAHIPAWWTTWAKAKEMYPNALVLASPQGSKKPYGRDPYGSYLKKGTYYDNEYIFYPLTYKNKNIHPKNKVLGIEIDGLPLVIDEAYVKEKKVVNFFFGPHPLIALFDTRLDIVRVFERRVWEDQLLFVTSSDGLLMDIETKTIWNYDGQAISGNLKNASMEEIFGINSFWFSWYTFHPESIVIPGKTVVPDSALIKHNFALE